MKKRSLVMILSALAVLGTCLMLTGCRSRETTRVAVSAPASEAPMGPRKILNWNGCRYAFLKNGSTYTLDAQDQGKKLGVLDRSILESPEENGEKDLAATFCLGGTVWEMKLWNPAFRVAVELDGSWYICENVDTLDGTPVIPKDYFAAADFENTVEAVEILDHMEQEVFLTLTQLQRNNMIELLSQAQPVSLTNEDYGPIGKAQREGESFRIRFQLRDGTDFGMYVIPGLDLLMLGDNQYRLPEAFAHCFQELFDTLPRQPLPMM